MKLCKNVTRHLQMHYLTLEFSNWLLLTWQWGKGAICYCQQLQIQFFLFFFHLILSRRFLEIQWTKVDGTLLYRGPLGEELQAPWNGSRWLPFPWKLQKCEKFSKFKILHYKTKVDETLWKCYLICLDVHAISRGSKMAAIVMETGQKFNIDRMGKHIKATFSCGIQHQSQ